MSDSLEFAFTSSFPVRSFAQNQAEYPLQANFKNPLGPSYLGKNGFFTPDKNLVRYDQIEHILPGLFKSAVKGIKEKYGADIFEPLYLNSNALSNWKRFVTDCYNNTNQVMYVKPLSAWVDIQTSIVSFKSNYQSNFPDYMKNISTGLKDIYFKEDISLRNKYTLHLANLNAKVPQETRADDQGLFIASGQILGVPPISTLHKDVVDYHQIYYPNKNFLGNEYIKYWFVDNNISSGRWYYRKLNQPASAAPGTSSHGWGISLDLHPATIEALAENLNTDNNFQWIKANIENYGWSAEANIDSNCDRYHLTYFKSDGPLYKGRPQVEESTQKNNKIILAKSVFERSSSNI